LERVEQEQVDLLVRRYAHRVEFFAGQVQRRFMIGTRWWDDLVSAGYWGLFKALRNRRPDAHERELSAYVSRRIHGAVIDEARQCLTRSSRTEVVGGAELHGLNTQGRELNTAGMNGAWEAPTAFSDGRNPEQMAARSWKRTAIAQALDTLQPHERDVMVSYMRGDTLSEIAKSQGVSAGTMQVRFQKLSRMLRARAPKLRRILLDSEAV
jgi:RNA polymerase sigma factor (sigma-70 family)